MVQQRHAAMRTHSVIRMCTNLERRCAHAAFYTPEVGQHKVRMPASLRAARQGKDWRSELPSAGTQSAPTPSGMRPNDCGATTTGTMPKPSVGDTLIMLYADTETLQLSCA